MAEQLYSIYFIQPPNFDSTLRAAELRSGETILYREKAVCLLVTVVSSPPESVDHKSF